MVRPIYWFGCPFPNLEQEIKCSSVSLHTLANHTHVSEEIMRDILSGEDALNLQEGLRLFEFFHFYSIPNDIYSFDYLFSKQIKNITAEQYESLLAVAEYCLPRFHEMPIKESRQRAVQKIEEPVATVRKSGRWFTYYAQYRHLLFDIYLLDSVLKEDHMVRRCIGNEL